MEKDGHRTGDLAPLAVDSRDAARLLSLSPRTVFTLTQRGDLPSFVVGRRRLYSVAALTAWVEEQAGILEQDLTLEELARLTGSHIETLRRLARAGKVPGLYRLGSRWMMSRAAANKLRKIDDIK